MVIRQRFYILIASLITIGVLALAVFHIKHNASDLPYSDHFAAKHAGEWSVLGGTWGFKDGAVINRSDERGAKLLVGSDDWKDYRLHAEIKVLGNVGDAGVLVRVNNATEGINGYDGYYAGLQLRVGALILGSSHNDWVAVAPAALDGGIMPGNWYSLDVVAVGCTVGAHLQNMHTGAEAWAALKQNKCRGAGRVGLRSVGIGAAWKDIHVSSADSNDLNSILEHVPEVKEPQLPTREDQYYATMLHYYGSNKALQRAVLQRELQVLSEDPSSPAPVRSIGSLRILNLNDRARIRGVVSLLDPLYVQDDTGGTQIAPLNAPAVNVGDEIEVVGTLQRGSNLLLQAEHVKVLSSKTPLLPISISSTQAASGEFEGTYVELRGLLHSVQSGKDGEYALTMDDGAQQFEVLVPPGLNSYHSGPWSSGSLLRVRGVCTEPTGHMLSDAAFVLLASGSTDIEVIAGPPWDRGFRLYVLIGFGLLLIAVGVAAYLKAERSRLQAAGRERELIAMEIHDTLAQSFAGVSFNLQSMKKIMEGNPGTPSTLLFRVRKACTMAAEAHREASDRMGSLHRASEDEDILKRLKSSAQSMLNGVPISVVMQSKGTPRKITPMASNALVRIGRELIANTLRHSRATELRLIAHYSPDRLCLSIEDNGDGFNPASESEGFGFSSVRIRARDIGATVGISSTRGSGTVVTIDSPYGAKLSFSGRVGSMLRSSWRYISRR